MSDKNKADVVNDDGSVTRTITTMMKNGDTVINIHTFTPDEWQKEVAYRTQIATKLKQDADNAQAEVKEMTATLNESMQKVSSNPVA